MRLETPFDIKTNMVECQDQNQVLDMITSFSSEDEAFIISMSSFYDHMNDKWYVVVHHYTEDQPEEVKED